MAVICEVVGAGIDVVPDVSLGTHFFNDLVEANMLYVAVHPKRRGEPAEWVYVLAHCLLHLGFGHLRERPQAREWNAACDCFLARFLGDLKLGRPPEDMRISTDFPARTEERLYEFFCAHGIPEHWRDAGTAGPGQPDMLLAAKEQSRWGREVNWPECFAAGLTQAVTSAVNLAGGLEGFGRSASESMTPARRAKNWFVNSFPLMGALATAFEIIEDPLVCIRLQISVAAVDIEGKEIFINPAAGLDEHETRFVMAHELLHVGLRHDARRLGATRICGTSPATTSSTDGSWKWAWANCRSSARYTTRNSRACPPRHFTISSSPTWRAVTNTLRPVALSAPIPSFKRPCSN